MDGLHNVLELTCKRRKSRQLTMTSDAAAPRAELSAANVGADCQVQRIVIPPASDRQHESALKLDELDNWLTAISPLLSFRLMRDAIAASQIAHCVGCAPQLHLIIVALEEDGEGSDVLEVITGDLVLFAAGRDPNG